MPRITMRVTVHDEFGRFASRLDRAASSAARDFEREGVSVATALVPRDTGYSASTIHASGSGSNAVWTAGGPAAAFHEDGTRPHPIEGNPYLVFTVDGRKIRTTHVNHPGSAGQHFMLASFNAVKASAMGILARYYG